MPRPTLSSSSRRSSSGPRPASTCPPSCSATSWSATVPPRRGVPRLSHLDAGGAARMVDVSAKPVTAREAVARGRIRIAPAALSLARRGRLPKGGVAEVARLAGILAAKRTAEAIPLCHPLPLTHVDVDVSARRDGFEIEARVRTQARTGAEMEALHAVAVAALTVYDMVKAADRAMTITDIRLVRKSGGKSGADTAR
ncbi:MAG: cyclic pyranopterin monophosphate synthase MoaC [Acidobacteria bacterium]|nr:MAG: cyclic pyranopterin monophosphate synthase MoaC [Acidobacteriota bacterium]PYQ22719.1 MAG: cyclic pyranopterin monophosphate synthase MoaC [Acidobacteriota bacterium]